MAASPSASSWWWRSIGARERSRERPAAHQHAADDGVVDAELEALAPDTFLGGARVAVDLRRVTGVGVQQDQLADVVQEARDGQAVALLVADLGGDHRRSLLRGEGVQSEALGHGLPDP